MADFFYEYFIRPVLERSGYNPVNTAAYAIIALACAYGIYRLFGKLKIGFDTRFVLYTIPFMLLGASARVVTDSVDSGVMADAAAKGGLFAPAYSAILASHFYDYGFLTTTPGIYVIVGILTIVSAICSHFFLKKPSWHLAAGLALLLPHLLLVLSLSQYWIFAALVLALAIIPAFLAYKFLLSRSLLPSLAVFAHSLDGAATFVVIDVFSKATGRQYFEQHVLSSLLGGTQLGFFLFFLVKAGFSAGAAHLISQEKGGENEKNYVLLLLIIFGLAPGVRDLLRMLAGT